MTSPVKVALEPYAALRAEIDSGEPVEAVIDRAGITEDAWAASQAFWLKQMADEAENQRFETTTRYQTLYRTQRKLLDADARRKKRAAERAQAVDPEVGPLAAAEKELSARPTSTVGAMPLVPPPLVTRPVAAPSFLDPSSHAAAPGVPPPMPFTSVGAVAPPAPVAPSASAVLAPSHFQPPAAVARPAAVPPPQVVAPPAMVNAGVAAQGPASSATPDGSLAQPPMARRLAELGAMGSGASTTVNPTPPPMVGSLSPHSVGNAPASTNASASNAPVPPLAANRVAPVPQRESSARTMSVDIEALMASAVPFNLGETPTPPPPKPAAPEPGEVRKPAAAPPEKQNLMNTMMLDVDQLKAHATPFSGAATQPLRDEDRPNLASGTPFEQRGSNARREASPAPPSSRSHAVSPQEPPRPAIAPQPFSAPVAPPPHRVASLAQTMVPDEDDDPRTMMIDGASSAVGSAARPLPFGSTTVNEPPKSARDAPGQPGSALPFSAPGASGEPLPVSHATASHASPSVVPASTKIFSINQFASLTAEIAEHPENIEEVRRKYGVTETQHHAESQRWTEEFAMSSELRQRYFGIVARYREYLRKKP